MINTIAASTLGVYMIHESAVARSVIWHGLLKVDKLYMGALFSDLRSCVYYYSFFGMQLFGYY